MYKLTRDKFLSKDEQLELSKSLGNDRDSLMIRLAQATGARATEIVNLTVEDVNKDNQSITIHGLKKSNDREIPLNTELYTQLGKYISGRVSGKLFPIKYRRFKQIWDNHSPKKLHATRHTFAVELYKRTRDIKLVQLALGHKNIANTMVYVDFVYSQEELRKLIL